MDKIKQRRKELKERSMRVLFRLLFGRTLIIVLLLIGQLALIFGAFYFMQQYYKLITILFTALTVIIVIYIVNSKENPAFKLAWMMPVCAFPVFGALLFLFVRINPGNIGLTKKLSRRLAETEEYLDTDERVRNKLSEESDGIQALSHYIEHINGYPTFDRTKVTYFPQGEDKIADLMVQLKKAEKFIFLEYFIIDRGIVWDGILEILLEKAAQGVEVRLMYDGMCSLVKLPYTYPAKLRKMGIKAKAFSQIKPLLSTRQNNRDHRKILVIDGKIAYTGGVNLADEYINHMELYGHWKDTAVKMEGDAAMSFTAMFLQMWNLDEKGSEDYQKYLCVNHEPAAEEGNGYVIPYNDTPTNQEDVAEAVYLDILSRSKKYVHIMTPYLIVENELLVALSFAAKRGVDVKLMLPHIPDKKMAFYVARTYYPQLLEAGVKIYEYTPGFLHAKIFVSDDEKAVVGSINLDFRSLYEHFECAAYIYHNNAVHEIEEDFQNTLKKCMEMSYADYKRLPLFTRVIGRVFRFFGPLM